MVVDSSAIRKKARKEYDKAKRELERAKQQLETYQKKDQPEFNRWVSRIFGPLLTEIRETDRVLRERRLLVYDIQSVVMLEGLSYARAYEEVMRRRQNPSAEPPANEGDPFAKQPGDEDGFDQEAEGARDPFEEFAKAFEEASDAFNQFFNRSSAAPGSLGQSHQTKSVLKRLKELYRTLARKLHPDAQSEMTAQKLEWWHQVQEAYAEGDAERLEVILTLCQIEEKGSTATTSVSLLGRITTQLKRALREVKREITQCRRSPAWHFTQRPDHSQLAYNFEYDLRTDLHVIKTELAELEAQLQRWAELAARRAAHATNKKSAPRQKQIRQFVRRARGPQVEFFF